MTCHLISKGLRNSLSNTPIHLFIDFLHMDTFYDLCQNVEFIFGTLTILLSTRHTFNLSESISKGFFFHMFQIQWKFREITCHRANGSTLTCHIGLNFDSSGIAVVSSLWENGNFVWEDIWYNRNIILWSSIFCDRLMTMFGRHNIVHCLKYDITWICVHIHS